MEDAAIITIGTELVEGLRADTNGPIIARELSTVGFTTREMVSVGDDTALLEKVIARLCAEYPLVVSTGGLGPTHDDVTRESAARALGLKLQQDERTVDRLAQVLPRIHNEADEGTSRQAQRIEGAQLIYPAEGTAPAQVVPTKKGRLLLLPGPPDEALMLLERFVDTLQGSRATPIDFSTFGFTETEIQHKVQEALDDRVGVGFTVLGSVYGVHVILTDEGADETGLYQAATDVRTALGTMIYSEYGETLAECVIRLAMQRNIRLVTAESCTGGMIAAALTAVPGASKVFKGSVVSYSNEVKVEQLGVSQHTLVTNGAVSEQTARQMAQGARKRLHADLAVSVTGIAGPDGGSVEKPVGTVWFGLSDGKGEKAFLRSRSAPREWVRAMSTAYALDLLRRRLQGLI